MTKLRTVTWVTRWRMVMATKPTLPGVWLRKDGGFVVRARVKHPRSGKVVEIFKVVDTSDAKEALVWLTRERQRVQAGAEGKTAPSFPRFHAFAAQLLEEKIASGDLASAATRELWGDVLENHLIKSDFASFYVDQIRTRDVLDWRASITIGTAKGEFSPHTANVWIRILKVIVGAYVARYELDRNPVLALAPFDTSKWRGKITKEQPNSLTPGELPMFLALMRSLHPQFFALTALGFAIGARPSTLRPLRRSGSHCDYDRETGELVLRQSHTRGRAVMPATKNGEDVTIILPPDLREILTWHIDEQLVEDDPGDRKPRITRGRMAKSELLFPAGRTGWFLSTTALWKPFASVSAAMTKATGGKFAKAITPKGMRRTNKDLMRAAGVRDIVAMAISNHLDDEMHAHYSTVSGAEMTKAVAQVIDLASFRKAHQNAAELLAPLPTTVPTTRP
jgi:hypothetical protein